VQLTGCNGSGKSSLFRCLGALWEVPEGGTITKPGGNASGLNAGVFYLPQKPYNVIGTLADQLAYPESKEGTFFSFFLTDIYIYYIHCLFFVSYRFLSLFVSYRYISFYRTKLPTKLRERKLRGFSVKWILGIFLSGRLD
jgi:hypothetical protein